MEGRLTATPVVDQIFHEQPLCPTNGGLPDVEQSKDSAQRTCEVLRVRLRCTPSNAGSKHRRFGEKVIVVFFVAPAAEERNPAKQFQVFAGLVRIPPAPPTTYLNT